MRPKKLLGQNFLTRDHFAIVMAEKAAVSKKDTVLEIGPGTGMLTKVLLERAKKVVAIEKDKELVRELSRKFKREIEENKLSLIAGDVRDFYQKEPYKVVANIPYYITGEIMRHFLEAKWQPTSMTLMVQKEVAERILARDKKESLLSLSVKAYGMPSIAARVPAGNFYPKPKVDSAILHIGDISKNFFNGISEKKFFEMLRAGFAHKRKKLISNLSMLNTNTGREALEREFLKAGIPVDARAETVSLEKWVAIATVLS
jgi:16S rRNA (adenine1518-N6/adenine1519-N6)-dimethyltransferase